MSVGHYENFPVASFLVPARERRAVVAIYRFARAADDLADEGDDPPEARLEALARFRRAVDAIAAGVDDPLVREPPFAELARAVREHALPTAPLADLLSAFAQDVTVLRYADFAALADYCRRSADPVGRLLLALYRRDSAANLPASDAICTGLQLANFCQDVAIDHAKGRVYLPQDELARFGVQASSILRARAEPGFAALMAFEVARAREWYDRAMRQLAPRDRRAQRASLAMAAIYRTLLDEIERDGFRVLDRRIALTPLRKLWIAWRTARAA